MIKIYPDDPRMKFGYLGNFGKWAKTKGALAAAIEGVANTMRSELKEIIQINPEMDGAGGYRFMGLIHYRTPYIPFITDWTSDKKALKLVKKSLKKYPDHPGNNFIYGKLLYERGKKKRRNHT